MAKQMLVRSNRESQFTASEKAKWCKHFGNHFSYFWKFSIYSSQQPCQQNFVHIKICTWVFISFSNNCSDLEESNMQALVSFHHLTQIYLYLGREFQLRNCLRCIILWVCLWSLSFMNDYVEGPGLLWVVTPGQVVLSHGEQDNKQLILHVLCPSSCWNIYLDCSSCWIISYNMK